MATSQFKRNISLDMIDIRADGKYALIAKYYIARIIGVAVLKIKQTEEIIKILAN